MIDALISAIRAGELDQQLAQTSSKQVAQTEDPYGVVPDLPEQRQLVGREYFARSPGSDIWVWFSDLPKATKRALWKKHKSKLAFPAGLPAGFFEL